MELSSQPKEDIAKENLNLKQKIARLEEEIKQLKAAESSRQNHFEQLQHNNALLDTLFDNAPIGIGLWDTALRFVRVNNALAQINGLPPQAHLGKTVQELLPNVESKVMETFRRVVETGEPVINQEVTGATPARSGQLRSWLVSYYPVHLEGEIVGVGAVCEETTAKKQAEVERESLLKREQEAHQEAQMERSRLNSLFLQAPAVIAIQEGPRHIFRLVNPLARQVLGGRDVTGLSVRRSFAGSRGQGFNALLDKVYQSGEPFVGNETQVRLNQPDGTVREAIFNLIYQPWRDAHDQIAGVMTFAVDVTEQVEARQAAQESEERFRLLADVSTVLATSLNYERTLQNIVDLSVPFIADWCSVDMLGEDGVPRRVATAHLNPKKRELAHRLLELYPSPVDQPPPLIKGLMAGQSQIFPEISEAQLALIARSPEHFQTLQELGLKSGINIPLAARGQVFGAFTLGITDSERRYNQADLELAQELGRRASQAIDNARLYEEARSAIEARTEFLSVAAHELKTPLTGLSGYVQLLTRQLDKTGTLDPTRVRSALDVITRQSNKLNSLMAQLLDVSRIEAGRLSLEPVMTNLSRLVEGTVSAAQARTSNHQLTFRASFPDIEATVDPVRIEQVVVNLVDNAIKYSPEGGPIEVELALLQNRQVYLAVSDRGVGISPEHRARIFDRFYQVNERGYLKGMGLGLYISRQIVELHHGQIEVEAPAGGGSRFIVRLPQGG